MRITLSVREQALTTARLEKFARELHKSGTRETAKTLYTAQLLREALDYVRSISPRFKRYGWHSEHDGLVLADSWRGRRETNSEGVELTVHSILQTAGGLRGAAKLKALEYGTRATTWTAGRTFQFFNVKGRRTTIHEGQRVNRPARRGHEFTFRTSAYLKQFLLPEFAEQTQELIKRRMEQAMQ